jgi:hypothetical protein
MRTNFFYGICFLTEATLTNAVNTNIHTICGAGKDNEKLNKVEEFFADNRSLSDLEKGYLCHIVHRFAGSTKSEDDPKIAALLDDLDYRMNVGRNFQFHAPFTSKFCPSPSREIAQEMLEKFERIAKTNSKKRSVLVKRNLNRVHKRELCWQLRRLDRNPGTEGVVTKDLAALEHRVKSWIPSRAGIYALGDEIMGNEDTAI